MKKGKVKIKITKDETIFIDGRTGDPLTPQEFARRHKKGIDLGGLGKAVAVKKG